jgi:hypothetical protein
MIARALLRAISTAHGGLAFLILVSACGGPQIVIPVSTATIMWGNVRADYATAKTLITIACRTGRLEKEACEDAKQLDLRAQVYRENIEKALANPEVPIDWQQVMAVSEATVNLLLKVGLLP